MTTILAVDPGGNTGVVVMQIQDTKVVVKDWFTVCNNIEFDWYREFLLIAPKVIVLESVVTHGKLTSGKVDQIKAVGILEQVAYCRDLELEFVTPEERGQVKKVLAEIKGVHVRDAFRVGIAYALKKGLIKLYAPDLVSTER